MSKDAIPLSAIQSVQDRDSFFDFLRNHLGWPIQDVVSFDELTYVWAPESIGLKRQDLKGSMISQLRPFVTGQPWGIFFVQLASPRIYLTELRQFLRALTPSKRKLKDYPTWNPPHVLLICTSDWKNYTFAHFEGDDPQKAKISTFGWEYQSPFVRTLCEFNIPHLRYPEDQDMYGLDPEAWMKEWSAAFDVKMVTDKFYEEYDKVFRDMKRILAPKFKVSPGLYDKKYEDWTEKQRKLEEPLHLFVQNLVNRLMFLKFLEKRRWLDFNPNYLRDLYKRAHSEKRNFYKEYLFYVFFAGLNRQVFKIEGSKEAQFAEDRIGVLPFLNGGLFEKEPIDEKVEIPNEAFTGLLELFSRYNFTVNEDTPLDVEVAVNPEMLGKVFEESVIARKEKGAYYTPRNIVSFMCREALKNHLLHCNIDNAQAKIEQLVDEHSAKTLEAADAIEIYKSLHNIKVLDPAVGSGAFPVNMMLELVQIYKSLGEKLEHDHPYLIQNKLANPKDVYNLKKQIIQNSLYGVDIEEFAINIARLRFWLSLAVDFPINFSTREEFIERVHEIEPLPNLLYKLRCGDSLLARYHGVSLEPHGRIATGEYNTARRDRLRDSIKEVTAKKREFYTEGDSTKKKNLQENIESNLRNLVIKEIDIQLRTLKDQAGQHGMFEPTKQEKTAIAEIEREITHLERVRQELSQAKGLPTDFPVIWDVEFGDVLSEEGFDVVIANPPYVRQEEIKELKEDLKLHYECYTGIADLYVYFYERGIQLLKPSGTITYISSNKFFRAGYGEKLREHLTHKTSLKTIIDFADLPVFEATTYPCVLIATKNNDQTGRLRAIVLKTEEQLEHFEEVFRSKAIQMRQKDLRIEGWRIEDKEVLAVLEKISKVGITLEEHVQGRILSGIKTGFNEAFVIDRQQRDNLIKEHGRSKAHIKPFVRGRDIKRFVIEDRDLFMLYIPWNFAIDRFPSIHSHLKKFEEQLKSRVEVREGRHPWFAMSRYAADYVHEFETSKIMLPDIAIRSNFAIDDVGNYYAVNTTYIIGSADKCLLAQLNSRITDFQYETISTQFRGGYLRFTHQFLARLVIATPTKPQRRSIEERVEKILAAKKKNSKADTSALEKEIDNIVYEVYGLTEEERKIVEGKK